EGSGVWWRGDVPDPVGVVVADRAEAEEAAVAEAELDPLRAGQADGGQAPPHDLSGEDRSGSVDDVSAHRRVDAVGPDDEAVAPGSAVREVDGDAVVVLDQRRD